MTYRHGMDTESLRWFQLVADGYTVTEVSDVFGVSQSGSRARWPGSRTRSAPRSCTGRAGSCG